MIKIQYRTGKQEIYLSKAFVEFDYSRRGSNFIGIARFACYFSRTNTKSQLQRRCELFESKAVNDGEPYVRPSVV